MKIAITIILFVALLLSWNAASAEVDMVGAVVTLGDKACTDGRYDAAARTYETLLKGLDPKSPWTPYVRYRLGSIQLIKGKTAEALPNIEPLARLYPDNAFVAYDYARALFYNKKYKEAVPVFEKAASRQKGFEPGCRYYIGACRIALGDVEEGKKDLKKVVEASPGSAEAKNAQKLLANVEKLLEEVSGMERVASVTAAPRRPTKEKPWAVSLSLGLEYDSNVGLIPSDQEKPEDVSNTGDFRVVHSLAGTYEFLNTGEDFAGVRASIYGTTQFRDTLFNVENTLLSLYYKRNFANTYQFRVSPFVSKTWLKSGPQNWFWGVTPGVSWQPVSWTWTDLDYTYMKQTFLQTPDYPQEDRSGDNSYYTLKQNFSFPSLFINKKNTYFGAWLSYGKSNTDGQSYDNSSQGFGVQAQQEFPEAFTALATYGYTETRYDNANIRSSTGDKRNDSSHILSLNLFKRLNAISDHLTAYAGWRWFKNHSNIREYYSYDSNTYSIGVILDF
ncbi:MAG: Tetratricopeptide repeat protein [Syntrophorhabdus sp. PtaB.Bin047]|nr:MAG: Tetratricopeptide repeat protein [Syntrophorhabdus sp. PtaB.Bin047]